MPAVVSCGPFACPPPSRQPGTPSVPAGARGTERRAPSVKRGLPLDRQGFTTTSVGAPKQRVQTETPEKPERTATAGRRLTVRPDPPRPRTTSCVHEPRCDIGHRYSRPRPKVWNTKVRDIRGGYPFREGVRQMEPRCDIGHRHTRPRPKGPNTKYVPTKGGLHPSERAPG